MPWGSIAASVAGSVLSGAMGSDASGNAADAANAGIQQGLDAITKIGDRTRTDTAPYRALGSGSANKLAFMLGVGGSPDGSQNGSNGRQYTLEDFFNYGKYWAAHNSPGTSEGDLWKNAQDQYAQYQNGAFGTDAQTYETFNKTFVKPTAPTDYSNTPGYGSLLKNFSLADLNADPVYNTGLQFGLDTGVNAINAKANSSGSSDSGATLKALVQYGNDYGTTKASGASDRFMANKAFDYNSLMGGSNIGMDAVKTDATTGMNLATAISGGNAAMGANTAGGILGSNKALTGAVNGVANTLGGIDWSSGSAGRNGNVSSGIQLNQAPASWG